MVTASLLGWGNEMVEFSLIKDLIALRENISVHGNDDYWQKKKGKKYSGSWQKMEGGM